MAHVVSRHYPVGSPQARVTEVVTQTDPRFEQPVPRRYTRIDGYSDALHMVIHMVSQVHGVWRVPVRWSASYRASQGYPAPVDETGDHLLFLVESYPFMTARERRADVARLCELVLSPTGVWSLVRVHA